MRSNPTASMTILFYCAINTLFIKDEGIINVFEVVHCECRERVSKVALRAIRSDVIRNSSTKQKESERKTLFVCFSLSLSLLFILSLYISLSR